MDEVGMPLLCRCCCLRLQLLAATYKHWTIPRLSKRDALTELDEDLTQDC